MLKPKIVDWREDLPDVPSASDPRTAPKKGGRPAGYETVRDAGEQTTNDFPASMQWAEVIGRAPQNTWCYLGEHQRKKNQKPDLVPPSAWKYFFQILLLWSLK